MCKRLESIDALGAAADRLTEACEARIHAPPPLDRANPVRSGISAALRKAYRELGPMPADMAVVLRKTK